ncbi:transglycosylase SLT domain-containing protein [Prescottella agglutinans]|uniref:Transglycosylase SLT domain-containing protein n=1 Tax=Prescottella agglutinans TaxID=1644129 RepID=A0ABT6MEP9_9NOCA|nr:transglycosylase SLT domain-containing protein [Prescottella agglutinans]MDH6282799.1 hypothetical protein [Prescottella agglutinans]
MVDGPYNAGSAHLTIKPRLISDWKARLDTDVKARRVEGTVFMNPELVNGFASKAKTKAQTAVAGKSVSIKVEANLTGFVQDLNTKLRPLDDKSHVKVKATSNLTGFVSDLNSKLRTHDDKAHVKVKAESNLTGFIGALNAKLRPLDNKAHVKVQVNPNVAGLSGRIRDALKAINLPPIKLKVEPNFGGLAGKLSGAQTLASGKNIKLPVDLDFTIAKAQLAAFKASAGNITINVDLDSTAAASHLASLMAQAVALRALLHNIPVNTSGGLGGRGGGGLLSGGKLALGAVASIGAVNLVPIIGQLAQMSSLLLTLPAAATAAAAGISALVVGSIGVFEAFKTGLDISKNASKDAEQAAKAQETAQKQLRSAVESATDTQVSGARQVASAERGVESAQKSGLNAQKDLTRARKDAASQVEDLNRALKGSALDEKEAMLAVRRARQNIADLNKSGSKANGLDRDEARAGYERAIQNLDDVRARNKKLADDAADANRKGVENADVVVAAKERVTEANQGIADSQRELAEVQSDTALANERAARQVAEAQTALSEAMSDPGDSVKKYEEALAKLSPAARSFVEQIRGMGGEWEDLRLATQESLFAGMDADTTNLIRVNLPTLKQGLVGIAGELNGITRKVMSAFAAPDAVEKFGLVLERIKDMFARMEPGFFALAGVFKNLVTVGSEFLGGFADGFTDGAQKLERWSMNFDHIRDLIRRGIDTLKDFWEITKNVGGSIGAIFAGSRQEGEGMIASIKDATGKMKDYLKSAEGQEKIKDFFHRFREMLDRITPILGDIGRIIVQSVVPAMGAWGQLVGPIVGGLVALLERFPDLTSGVVAGFMVWKTINPIISGVTSLVTTLGFSLGWAGALGVGVVAAGFVLAKLGEDQRKAADEARAHKQAVEELRNTLDADTGRVTQGTVDSIREKAESGGRLETASGFGLGPQEYMDAIVQQDPGAYNNVRQRLNADIIGQLKSMPGVMAQFEREGMTVETAADALAGDKAALERYRQFESRPGNQYRLDFLKGQLKNEGQYSAQSALDLMTSVNAERQHLGLSQEGWQRTNESTGGNVAVTPEIAEYFRNLSVDDSGPLGIELEPTMPNRNTAFIKGQLTPTQRDALNRKGFNPKRNTRDNTWSINLNSDDAFFELGPMIDRAAGAPTPPPPPPSPPSGSPTPTPAPAGPRLRPSIPMSDADFSAMPRTMQNLYAEQTPGPTRNDLQGLLDPTGQATKAATTSDPQGRVLPAIGEPAKTGADVPPVLDPIIGAPPAPAPAAEPTGPDYSQAVTSWNIYADAVKAGFDEKIRPSLDGILGATDQIRKSFSEGLQGAAVASWSEFVAKVTGDQGVSAIQLSFAALTGSLYDLANHFTIALVQNAAQREVDLANSTSTMVSTIGQIHFVGLGIALDNLAQKFADTVGGIGRSWDGLKGSVANPINWIIDKVINTGLRDAWNGVRGVVPDLPEWTVNVPKIEGFSTGGIMSGYAPGVDDRVIMVGPGEGIMRPEVVRGMGADWVNGINAAARTGGVAAVQQFAGRFANGGIVDSMRDVVAERFPMLLQNGEPFSGLRFTDNGYHSKGMAADFSNGGDDGTPEMQQLAGWIAANWQDKTIQLIHSPFGHNIMDGGFVGDGMSAYGAGTMAEHRNHVHWAIREALDGRAADLPALAGGLSFGGAARRILSERFEKPLAELRSQMPDFGPSLLGQLPGKLFDKLSGEAAKAIRGTVGAKGSLDAGNTAWDISAGVEQWHDNIVAALIREGFEPSERNILLTKKQIMTESGGNPNIVQQVQDVNSGGNEAVGLLQVIPNTFAAYRNPELPNDRTNPDASLSAGLRWYRHSYGDDLGTMWGQGHGYDQGGIANGLGMMPKWTLEPERVLSPQQTRAFETLVKLLKDPKFIEAISEPYKKINPWRDPNAELDAQQSTPPAKDPSATPAGAPGAGQATPDATVQEWVPKSDGPIIPPPVDPVQQAKEAELEWFATANPEATLTARATDLAASQAVEIESWLRDNWKGMAETAGSAAAGPLVSISGGIHTTNWDSAQRTMNRSINRAAHANMRKGGR